MLHKTFSSYNFTAFTIDIHKMCQGSESSTTIMITIGILITMKTIILKSSEEIELFYSGSEYPAPSAEVERIKYCNFILDLVCQNNQMTPFQKECYSTFRQITETAPLLYEVLHIKQKTKKLGPETSFYSF